MEYPVGHRRRRTEGMPLLVKKFQANAETCFPLERVARILALFEDDRLVYKDMLEGLRSVRMQPIPGVFLSMTESALGRSILAFLPRERVLKLARESNAKMPSCHMTALFQELDKVRRSGFALDDEQVEKGLRCVGAPIFDRNGLPIASISVSGSTRVLDSAAIRVVAAKVKRACDEISLELTAPNRPGLLKGGPNFLYVIMPVNLQ